MNEQIEVVSDPQMWALIVGFLSPLLIATIQQPKWSGQIRVFVTLAWAVIVGSGTAFFADEFTGKSVVSCALVIGVTSIASYQSIWVPTKIAPRIEAMTSPRAHVEEVVTSAPTAVEGAHRASEGSSTNE